VGRFFGPTPNIISSEGFFRGSAAAAVRKTWTQVTTGFEATGTFFFGSYANGLYLVTDLAGSTSRVISSPDLVTFASNTIAVAANFRPRSVIFAAGTYFTVLDNNGLSFGVRGYTSPDLVTWTLRATGFPANAANQRVFLPVFGNGVFLLVSQRSANYATSPDGVTWTQRSAYVPTEWGQPVFDGTQFVAAVLGTAASAKVATSLDGINWTESSVTLTAAFNAGSSFFWLGNDGTSQYIVGESSDDAGNALNGSLTGATLFSFNDAAAPTASSPIFSGVSWARNNARNGQLVSSPDGLTWSEDIVPATARAWGNLAFGGSKFMAVGTDTSGHNMLATRGP
jgi:hypothetical protein